MESTRIKNFIKLIGKIHSKQRKQTDIGFGEGQIEQKGKKIDSQHYNTVNLDEKTDSSNVISIHNLNNLSNNETTTLDIFFNEETVKQRYDKKNLYEVYRQSLNKKKDYLHFANKKNNSKNQQNICCSRELKLPQNKMWQRRETYTYQKILRKKTILLSNRSISIIPYESERKMKIEKIKQLNQNQKAEGIVNSQQRQMRSKKLDYKPIFRIKKLNFQNFKVEEKVQENQVNPKHQKKLAKINKKMKTQPVENSSKFLILQQGMRIKDKEKCKQNDKFTAWDIVEHQQTSRLFL